jgi:hypothetical protein
MTCGRVMHWRSLLVSAVLALGLDAPGYSEQTVYDLCIEQSPARAGKVTPDSGLHRFCADSLVTLSAEPQPGYQFAYWLGDVTDPSVKETTVHVNSAKVIIAVFRPAEEDPFERKPSGGGGGGMLWPTICDLSSPAFTSPSGGGTSDITVVTIPTPEPTSLLLLTLGALTLRRRLRCLTRSTAGVPATA